MLVITIIAGRESFLHDICFFYRASLGGPDERREQKFATLVGDHFGMSPTNILLTLSRLALNYSRGDGHDHFASEWAHEIFWR